MDRVKFYSNIDMSSGYNFNKALDVIKNLQETKDNYNINEILEMFNILKFYNKEWLKYVEEEKRKLCKKSEKVINKIIGKYCESIDENNVLELLSDVDFNYIDDFFEFIDKYKIFNRISATIFKKILKMKETYLYYILDNKNLVNYYDKEIRQSLIKTTKSAEIILNTYEVEHINYNKKYFPKSFSLEDKENIFINYINSDDSNLNYLRIIVNLQSTSELNISDKTKLLAKKKVEEKEKNFFDKNSGIEMTTTVKFSKKIKNAYEFKTDDQNWDFTYDLNWIEEDKEDYSTLLNNFIYLFGYVDSQMRFTLVSKPSYMGTFEKNIFMRSKRDYHTSMAFNRLNQLADLQMIGYYGQLQKLNVRLEDIIAWFFEDYLRNEFKIENYNISMPSKDSNFLEKGRTLLPEIDSCLKQYNYYVEDGVIDSELLGISSTHLLFKNVKSLLKNKYVYPTGQEFDLLSYYLFSDQCMLAYVEKIKKKYSSFYDLIINENIKEDEIVRYEQNSLKKLIDDGYIMINENGYIKFKNKKQILVLKDITENEVISYWKLSKSERIEINNLVEKGLLKYDSSLFSKPEQNYLNYYLNKADFINSLDLRNMYSHGTQPFGDENIHYTNYIRFLKLFILIIIKINDELCIQDDIKKGVINE